MKIKNILAASLTGAILVSGIATAKDDFNFYVGAEAGYNKLKGYTGSKFKKKPSLGLVLGGKFHENFGAELGYTLISKSKIENTNVKVNSIHADAIGYLPAADKTNVLGSVGFARVKTKEVGGSSQSKTGLRFGLGAEYRVADELGVRLMARHQKGSEKIGVKSIQSVALGVTYDFM